MAFYLSQRQQIILLLIAIAIIVGNVTLRLRTSSKEIKKSKIGFTNPAPLI